MIVIIHDQVKLFWGGWVSRMFLLSFSVSEGEGARGSQLTTMLKDHSHGERLKFLESRVCIRKRPKQETSNLLQYRVCEKNKVEFLQDWKVPKLCLFSDQALPTTSIQFSRWSQIKADLFSTLVQAQSIFNIDTSAPSTFPYSTPASPGKSSLSCNPISWKGLKLLRLASRNWTGQILSRDLEYAFSKI